MFKQKKFKSQFLKPKKNCPILENFVEYISIS